MFTLFTAHVQSEADIIDEHYAIFSKAINDAYNNRIRVMKIRAHDRQLQNERRSAQKYDDRRQFEECPQQLDETPPQLMIRSESATGRGARRMEG